MKKPLKILVQDLELFIFKERVLFASGDGKRLFVRVYAAPGVPRYIVHNMKTQQEKEFIKKGEAVKYFNELIVEE